MAYDPKCEDCSDAVDEGGDYDACEAHTDPAPPGEWVICPDCGGDGTHVHDALSVPSEEYRDDPDFMEDYFAGAYDVSCARCQGTGKVHTGRGRDPGFSRARERCGVLVNEAGEPLESYSPGGM